MFKRVAAGISIALLTLVGSAMLLCSWSATGWKILAVPTASMHPAIPQNSLVLTHKVASSSLKVGDVITYVNPLDGRQTISHRIIKKYVIAGKVPAFVTEGDANKVADVPITEGSVVGKVVWHVPHIGSWLLWAKKPIALLPLIYLPALLLMAEEVKRLSDYYKQAVPYRLYRIAEPKSMPLKSRLAVVAGGVIVLVSALLWQPALALLRSNPVALANNQLSIAAGSSGGGSGSCEVINNTNVTVTNSSSQTASSGTATTKNTTNGGSATSGNVSNNTSSTTNISISNNGC